MLMTTNVNDHNEIWEKDSLFCMVNPDLEKVHCRQLLRHVLNLWSYYYAPRQTFHQQESLEYDTGTLYPLT